MSRKGDLEMRTCDICDAPLGMFKKFRYAEGYICKECYEKASNYFTETIAKKSYGEIRELCERKSELSEDFEITGRIGNYILMDEKNRKVCLLNNRINQKQVSEPEFYSLDWISRCRIDYRPFMSPEGFDQTPGWPGETYFFVLKSHQDQKLCNETVLLICKTDRGRNRKAER